jgi:hypothetical protein
MSGPEGFYPHQFDDPRQQGGNPDFPEHTYPFGDRMLDPASYERLGAHGQRQYYADRLGSYMAQQNQLNQEVAFIESPPPENNDDSKLPALEYNRSGPFRVSLSPADSLSELIERGNYDKVSTDISKYFSDKSVIDFQYNPEIELVNFNWKLPHKDLAGLFERIGVRSATVLELAALGARYPDAQRGRKIIAPAGELIKRGNRTDGEFSLRGPYEHGGYTYIGTDEGGERCFRLLNTSSTDFTWAKGATFAAVNLKPRAEAVKPVRKVVNIGPGRAVSPRGVILPSDYDIYSV